MLDQAVNAPIDSDTDASSAGERVIFAGLCLLVALAPLPLGSARPIAWSAIGLIVALLLAAQAVFATPAARILPRDLAVPLVLFALCVGYAGIQIVQLTPSRWDNPLWGIASETLGRNVPGSIAVDRSMALTGLLRLLTYAGVFAVTQSLCQRASFAHSAMKLAVLSGTAYAVYGLAVYWSGNQSVLWFAKWAYLADLTGSFVNRNSFATFLGLCLLAGIAQTVVLFGRFRPHGGWRDRVRALIEFCAARLWIAGCLFALALALVLTHSRGGFSAMVCGVAAFGMALVLTPELGRWRGRVFGVILVGLLIVAFVIAGDATLGRFMDAGAESSGRLDLYRTTLQAIGDYPILGTGLNSFASVYPIYQAQPSSSVYDLAHNDYLQNLLELGVPAAICLFAAVGWLFRLCVRGIFVRRRDAAFPCLGVAATVLVAIHSLVDFSLQIPAVTIVYVFIMGIAVAQSRSSRAAKA